MSQLTFKYDETYIPAFPVVATEMDGYSSTHERLTVTALVDSGADGTLIPLDLLQAVGASYEDTVQMTGITGGTQIVDRYTVALHIGTHVVRAVHAVAVAPEGEAVIGRDVLNELILTLNGPAYMTEVTL